MRTSTVLRWLVVTSFLVTVLLYLGTSLIPLKVPPEPVVGSSFVVFGCGLLAMPCLACFERGRRRRLMAGGMTAAAFSGAGWIALIWLEGVLETSLLELIARGVLAVCVGAGLCAVVAVLSLRRTSNPLAILLRRATFVAAALLAVSIVTAVWFEHGTDPLGRIIGALAVLTGAGSLTTFLVIRLRHLERAEDVEIEDVVRMDVVVRCPRCGMRQRLQTGGASCEACGLRIRIAVP